MSSNEDETEGLNVIQGAKKRRIQRACDICRRKKIRCDGSQMPGNRCSNCIAYSFDCTYVEAAKKRGPPKGYVEDLENRLEKMEKLFRKLYPDGDFTKDLEGSIGRESWIMDRVSNPLAPSHGPLRTPNEIATSVIRAMGSPIPVPEDDDDLAHVTLSDNIRRLAIDDQASYRFFGKSSGAMLIKTAIDLKNEFTGRDDTFNNTATTILGNKREQFWVRPQWEKFSVDDVVPDYSFPDDDLLNSLTDLYFKNVNLFFPLLHRPTFNKSVAEGLHKKSDAFGAVVMLVCANGARYSDDPRVLLGGSNSQASCGWKWFDQVQMVRKSLLSPPTLHDLQFYCLSVQFLQGSSAPQACWTMVGIGVRLAQDVGAHRRKVRRNQPTVEDEQWKRAFWVLVCMDRLISSALGRPCAIQDEDFDLDLPLEVDDEYWEISDPEQAFKQPPEKPSAIAYFNCYVRLNQVLAFALRTIYAINKSKILLGFVGQQWEQHIVAELDSALNKWLDSVPDHLRWDPNRENQLFFDQSVFLYSSYYHLQILIHRPFIPSPRKPSPLSFPSLAICTNAARSCSHIVDVYRRRSVPQPYFLGAVFTAGIVLLLNIWGGKRSGLSTDPTKEMADVYKCMQVLRTSEKRWLIAGRLWDILYELASVGDLPLPKQSPSPVNKRGRDSDSPISTTPTPTTPSSSTVDAPRSIAGSRRVTAKESVLSHSTPEYSIQQSQQGLPQNYPTDVNLPLYSDELGRLPLHGRVGSSSANPPSSDNNPQSWYSIFPERATPLRIVASMADIGTVPSTQPHMDQLFYEQMLTSVQPPSVPHYAPHGTQPGMHNVPSGFDPQQYMLSSREGQYMVDSDTISMWSNAPSGFELDDWGTYLSTFSELTQGTHTGVPHHSNAPA